MASFPFGSLLFKAVKLLDTCGLLCDRYLGSRGREPSKGGRIARSGPFGGRGGTSHVRDKEKRRSEPQGLDGWLGVKLVDSNLFNTGEAQ